MTETTTKQRPSDSRAWQKKWRVERARGIKRIVEAGRAQEHVQELTASHGLSIRGIAEVAGISAFIVSDLNRGRKQSLYRETEAAVLAVTPDAVLARSNPEGFVPNIGGRRRIQALMAMGWRHQDLTPMLGINTANIVHQQGGWFTKKKHDAIKELYDRIWNQRGPATTLSINRVAKAGYAPPLAWDDDTIDDPNAKPDLGAAVRGRGRPVEGTVRVSEAQLEDVEFLLDQALAWDAITSRLGVDPRALERMLYRKGRGDLVTRAKTMGERIAYSRAS
ncbi:hypothetical protein [Pseudarthrobacter sp. NIBRBAC000502770]|uniref:hypothetical protein n=1 Tax=Pseudarthrobacter sp. NIBRBAC000502770 TaxID=2590785 RepID=UPI00113FD701|nr:hypothetical protein [Pseudarthrobacter sp. NIBRBAC000502770]QDG88848.1 hypothetical protein NIBR502770_10460 [Pseudarthrobacter sp. NIBRBAC000502770]